MEKYLRSYSEPGVGSMDDIPAVEPWQQVVVIPVCNEAPAILRPLPPGPGRSLMILVVNETVQAPRAVSEANRKFAAEVGTRFAMNWQSDAVDGFSLYQDPDSSRDVLLVDRFSQGLRFSPGGGVGHARKIGADLAAFLFYRQKVLSPWIHCSDADVHLPQRYFSSSAALDAETAQHTAALLYPFHHSAHGAGSDHKIARVTQLYEYSLRYYVSGLSFAGSPYAFHTIGSTMAVNTVHYARVRGFPRRQAGEDFYLLNKLAKVGSILPFAAPEDCEPIEIASRVSNRVPFGTGAATVKLMKMENPAREFLLYHPAVFEQLQCWLASWPEYWQSRSSDISMVLHESCQTVLVEGLGSLGAADALQHALRQSADLPQFLRQMHTWFDAFRTLKLIHYLRDHAYPSICFEELQSEPMLNRLLELEPGLPGLQERLC